MSTESVLGGGEQEGESSGEQLSEEPHAGERTLFTVHGGRTQ